MKKYISDVFSERELIVYLCGMILGIQAKYGEKPDKEVIKIAKRFGVTLNL